MQKRIFSLLLVLTLLVSMMSSSMAVTPIYDVIQDTSIVVMDGETVAGTLTVEDYGTAVGKLGYKIELTSGYAFVSADIGEYSVLTASSVMTEVSYADAGASHGDELDLELTLSKTSPSESNTTDYFISNNDVQIIRVNGASTSQAAVAFSSYGSYAWSAEKFGQFSATPDAKGAQYIWTNFPVTTEEYYGKVVEFTKTFEVPGTPVGASIRIGADNGYSVSLNGGTAVMESLNAGWEASYNTGSLNEAFLREAYVPSGGWRNHTMASKPISGLVNGANVLKVFGVNESFVDNNTNVNNLNPAGVIFTLEVVYNIPVTSEYSNEGSLRILNQFSFLKYIDADGDGNVDEDDLANAEENLFTFTLKPQEMQATEMTLSAPESVVTFKANNNENGLVVFDNVPNGPYVFEEDTVETAYLHGFENDITYETIDVYYGKAYIGREVELFSVINTPYYALNMSASPSVGGTVSLGSSPTPAPSADGTFLAGTTVPVSADANTGYSFSNWRTDAGNSLNEGGENLTLTSNTSLTAVFTPNTPPSSPTPTPPPTINYPLTVVVEGPGSAAPVGTGSFSANSIVMLQKSADEGASFVGWFGENGEDVSNDRITMNSAKSIIARFVSEGEPVMEVDDEDVPLTAPEEPEEETPAEEIITDEVVAQDAPELPQTGGLPLLALLGAGSMSVLTGLKLKRTK